MKNLKRFTQFIHPLKWVVFLLSFDKTMMRDYVAGALVANAPMWLLNIILQYLKAELSFVYLGLILYFTAMAGSAVAGYLLERKRGLGYRKTGMTTGFTAYVLYSIYLTVVRVRGGVLEDFLPLMGFVIGGAIGARYREIQNRN
jgi:hypothetical protein